MKIQAILLALLQARTAFSSQSQDSDGSLGVALPDCALPCKSQLRAGASMMKECIKVKCGARKPSGVEVEHTGDDSAASDEERVPVLSPGNPYSDCVANCARKKMRQDKCIERCPRPDADVKEQIANDPESNETEGPKDDGAANSDYAESAEETMVAYSSNSSCGDCISTCARKRIRQDRCQARCPCSDDGAKDGQSEDKATKFSPGNPYSDCVANCARKKIRQDRCIERCPRLDDAVEGRQFYAAVN